MKKLLLLPLLLFACPPNPPPPVGGTDCYSVCAHLRAIGCSDGFGYDGGQTCEETCLHIDQHPITDFKKPCLAGAADVAAAKKCGSVSCAP